VKLLRFGMRAGLVLLLLEAAIACGLDRPIELKQVARSNSDIVMLSDLLLDDAPEGIRQASSHVKLCHTPEIGTWRTLSAEQIANAIHSQSDLIGQLRIPAFVNVYRAAWPIREVNIRDALEKFSTRQGLTTAIMRSAGLRWPKEFFSARENAALEVANWRCDLRDKLPQAQLRCRERSLCGSFVVQVVVPPAGAAQFCNSLGEEQGHQEPGASSEKLQDLVHKGDGATLTLQDVGMQMSLPVICLQSGTLGQEIKVFDAQRRRMIHARVVAADQVEANL